MTQTFPVVLRALEPQDWETTWRWRQDPDVWRYLKKPPASWTAAEEKEWLHGRVFQPGNDLLVGVERTGEPALIGWVQLLGIDRHHRQAGLEVVISQRELHNRGYGTAAALLMLNHAFVVLGLERVEARAPTNHLAALRLLEKTGFTPEAVLRRSFFAEGNYYDVQVSGLLREEFMALRANYHWPYPPEESNA